MNLQPQMPYAIFAELHRVLSTTLGKKHDRQLCSKKEKSKKKKNKPQQKSQKKGDNITGIFFIMKPQPNI